MDFVPGRLYNRRELHDEYGGQRQGGISTPANHPMVFLFTGEAGHQFGYRDGFLDDGTFRYFGEGQVGDMRMKFGNLAIRDHHLNGERLYLFKSRKDRKLEYQGEVAYVDHAEVVTADKNGDPRRAIAFRLAFLNHASGQAITATDAGADPLLGLSRMSLSALYRLATTPAPSDAEPRKRTKIERRRSLAVRAYVLKRACGRCECCGQTAPFKNRYGGPYLEPHHIRRLADEGPDHPRWVAALCPNCHRRIHSGIDGDALNHSLSEKIEGIETS
ncbi:MAG TPA: HNH endonuclease signature motif containing protein [Thermoanaerobaculales bacterium]|nr:HNH endonuclease signature motif containing protein [Thermoanaerobaculales bacterium]